MPRNAAQWIAESLLQDPGRILPAFLEGSQADRGESWGFTHPGAAAHPGVVPIPESLPIPEPCPSPAETHPSHKTAHPGNSTHPIKLPIPEKTTHPQRCQFSEYYLGKLDFPNVGVPIL